MKQLSIITILFAIALLTSCTDDIIQGDKLNLDNLSKTMKAIELPNKINLVIDSAMAFASVPPQTREDLGSMRTVVKIMNGSQSAGLQVPGFGGVTLGKDEVNMNVYYIETKTIDTTVYGIGYSVHYLFKKVKRGIDVSNIPSIAASAQLESNKTQVFYSLQTYGISGINLVKFFKPTVNKNFNVEGFGIMQSSIDGIHNILGDSTLSKTVRYSPEIIKFVKPNDLN
jgi:hypothetical protein